MIEGFDLIAKNTNTIYEECIKKRTLRDELEVEIAKFEKSGGAVKPLPGVTFKPRRPSTPLRVVFASFIQQSSVLRWIQKGTYTAQRRKAIANITGISFKRIQSITQSQISTRMTTSEYKFIREMMPVIEANEKANLTNDENKKKRKGY